MKADRNTGPFLLTFSLVVMASGLMAQNRWVPVEADQGPLERHENAFVKVGDAFHLLGGRGVKPLEIFDPATGNWTAGAIPPVEMSHFQAVSHQGFIYVMGGHTGGWPFETPLSNIHIYDPIIDKWMVGPKIPSDRQRGAAGAVAYNNRIYLVGGIVNGHTSGWVAWFDEYNPATNSWRRLPDAPRARDHFQAAVVGSRLVVAGGRKSGFQGQGFEATIPQTDVYDFEMGTWATLPSPSGDIPTQRAGCTAIAVGDEVIVIGGESGSQEKAHSEVEALNVKAGTWRKLPNLQTGRHGTQVILSEGQLYIAAGCGNRGGSPELNSMEVLTLSGARGEANEPIKPGVLKVSSSRENYGLVRPYSSQIRSFQLSNIDGNQGIPLSFVILTGSKDFEVDFPYDLPYIIAPGKSVQFDVAFRPTTRKASEATLFIKVGDRGKLAPQEIALKGN